MPEPVKAANKYVISVCEVRGVVSALLPAGHPSLQVVATRLGVSPRTLQRRLAENDLTYSQLVHQARVTKACHGLAQQDLHISEIARETGFLTPSSFSRAFQCWMGTSPREFRNGFKTLL
jgi:AraC-like DNA-binding protein